MEFLKEILGMPIISFNDNEPCEHPGCRAHSSHPCEVCGRINSRGKVQIDRFDYDKRLNKDK